MANQSQIQPQVCRDIALLFACQVRYARRRSREATHFCSLKLKREIKTEKERERERKLVRGMET